MGVALETLIKALNHELKPDEFKDYCPNGLQIEGNPIVNMIVSGVTASQALINKSIKLKADAILVHHGYFWNRENSCITGMKQKRIRTLLQENISLIAYHLPLDAHPVLGNNVQLAALMGWEIKGGLGVNSKHIIGNWGTTPEITLSNLVDHLSSSLKRTPLAIAGGTHSIKKLAWCTGAAQHMIEDALQVGADAFISGEISESTVHFARENNIHYLSAGHHATERYGPKALGCWIEKNMSIKHTFIDIESPV